MQTRVQLSEELLLIISTKKNDFTKLVETKAAVWKAVEDGLMQHSGQEYSKFLFSENVRATKKNIETQHSKVNVEEIIKEAKAFHKLEN